MVKSFIATENRVHTFFKVGSNFSFDNKVFNIIQSEKPTISANGECKTDLYVKAVSQNNIEKEFKFSIKKNDYWFVANKISLKRYEQIFGVDAQSRISKELLKIKNLFYENKLIYSRGKDKNIRIGWKFEVGKGKSGYLSEKLDLTDNEKIDFFAGTTLPTEKKDALINGVLVKNSGISNYIIITDNNETSLQDYADKIELISDYAPKIDLYFASKGLNFRVNANKWDGDRPLAVWVEWSRCILTNKISAELKFTNPLETKGNKVGENIKKILKKLNIDESNFTELEQYFDKFDKPFKKNN